MQFLNENFHPTQKSFSHPFSSESMLGKTYLYGKPKRTQVKQLALFSRSSTT